MSYTRDRINSKTFKTLKIYKTSYNMDTQSVEDRLVTILVNIDLRSIDYVEDTIEIRYQTIEEFGYCEHKYTIEDDIIHIKFEITH